MTDDCSLEYHLIKQHIYIALINFYIGWMETGGRIKTLHKHNYVFLSLKRFKTLSALPKRATEKF